MSTLCRSCQAEIIWALTANGKRMPLDAQPVPRPTGLFMLDDGDPPNATALHLATPLYVSHFATCPNASQHRKEER